MTSLQTYVERYLRECEMGGKAANTLTTYRARLGLFTTWCQAAGVDFTAANGREIRAYRQWLIEERNAAPRSVNLALTALRGLYDYLVEEEIVRDNPVLHRRLAVKVEQAFPRYLEEEEVRRLVAVLKRPHKLGDGLTDQARLALRTLLAAGLRISELVALRTCDVQPHEGRVFLHIRRGKGRRERVAPVTDAMVARALWECREQAGSSEDASLFGLKVRALQTAAVRAGELAGVRLWPHRLRHTLATQLLTRGVSLDVIQETLGHRSFASTRIYARTTTRRLMSIAPRVKPRRK